MTLLDNLNKNELKELLIKCWMTHDGAWFLSSYLHLGIKVANKLNKASIKILSELEMKRIQQARGLDFKNLNSISEIKNIMDDIFSVLKGEFMHFSYNIIGKNRIRWKIDKCFAYEGMKRLGIQEEYECGVIYRVCCWLDAMGIDYKLEPKVKKCLLNSQELCTGEIVINI